MKSLLHGIAILVVVVVSSLCVLVQLDDLDRAVDGLSSQGETVAER